MHGKSLKFYPSRRTKRAIALTVACDEFTQITDCVGGKSPLLLLVCDGSSKNVSVGNT